MSAHEIQPLAQRIEFLVQRRPQRAPFLFLHIPHTASASLTKHIAEAANFATNEVLNTDNVSALTAQNIEHKKLIFGHLSFGFDARVQSLLGSNAMWRNG